MSGLFDFGSQAPKAGGAKRRSSRKGSKKGSKKSSASSYKRTTRKHVSKSGVKRTIYTKDGKDYIKRRSKTGKVRMEKL